MYASNEDEGWVYLHETPPVNSILQKAVKLIDRERSHSSSSDSITNCSLKSSRSISLSSISSTEPEHADNTDTTVINDVLPSSTPNSIDHHVEEQNNHLTETTTIEDPLLFARNDDNIPITNDIHFSLLEQLISPVEENEILPLETVISHSTDNPSIETPVRTDENDVFNTGFELSKTLSLTNSNKSFTLPNDLRRRTTVNTRQSDLYNSEPHRSTPICKLQKRIERHQNKNHPLVSCTCLIVLLTIPFILGHIVTQWNQSTMNKIVKELDMTKQRLNAVKDVPFGNIEQRITIQLEEKFRNIINQKLTSHEQEKETYLSQIHGLQEILDMTRQNLTNTVYQLSNENRQLQERVTLLERRLGITEGRRPKETNICLAGVNCTNPSISTLNKLVSNIFNQTISIAADTSINLSGLFEHLSASVSDLVDHRHEYVDKSKRKLTDITGSSTSKKFRTTFRRSVENLSSSLRNAKSTYATWLKSRAQRREQAQMENYEKQQQPTARKYPWGWIFPRDYDQERMYYSKGDKEHVCRSKISFPMRKICSLKDWMTKFFRP